MSIWRESQRFRCALCLLSLFAEVFAMHAPIPTPEAAPATTPEAPTGRDASGRFTRGNPGGPGNPYYRRQAQLKRLLLESVTDADVQSVMQVLLGLARSGDLAAIKLFLEYTVGKPAKEVDPDKEELHEWGLQQQTPRLQQVLEVMARGIETPTANQVVRDMVPIVGDCHLKTVSQHLRNGTDYDGHQIAPPLEETLQADGNGGKRPGGSARRMAAGVRSAVETGDNGEDDDDLEDAADMAWWEYLASESSDQTGDNGGRSRHRPDGSGSSRGPGRGPR
jgi:hypothetical protein